MHMLFWSAKGGSGTTTVAVAVALRRSTAMSPALVVDLGGDVFAVLGEPEPHVTLDDWLLSTAGPAALDALVASAGPLRILAVRAPVIAPDGRWHELSSWLAAQPNGSVVVDLGLPCAANAKAFEILRQDAFSVLVIRPCYLAARRAVQQHYRPDGVVVVSEEGRSLDAADIESAIGAPVIAEVEIDPAIARAVDAGALGNRLPRLLSRRLRSLWAGPMPLPVGAKTSR